MTQAQSWLVGGFLVFFVIVLVGVVAAHLYIDHERQMALRDLAAEAGDEEEESANVGTPSLIGSRQDA